MALEPLLRVLALDPGVEFVEPLPFAVRFANADASWLLQSGIGSPVPVRSLRAQDLTGVGQVVALVTFKDHCQFKLAAGASNETAATRPSRRPGTSPRRV